MPMQQIKKYASLGLKLLSLGLVIGAGSFWAGAGVDKRPKYRDEQTLVGGAIWSQILIPLGLLLSKIVGEEIKPFIHGYYLITGVILLLSTGIVLITYECLSMAKQKRISRRVSQLEMKVVRFKVKYDKIYLCIGILSILAGFSTFADFIVLLI